MVTIRDIALHAGVSNATVSRVVNGKDKVSPKLQERVKHAMEELQYYPNSIARGLKIESTMTIGMIVLDLSNSQLANLSHSVCNRLYRANYLPLVCSTDSNPATESNYIKLLMSHKVDGIIINSCVGELSQIVHVSHLVPIVSVYRRIDHASFRGDFVDSDGISGSYAVTKLLLEQGHRNIFIINGPLYTSAGRDRFSGFCHAMLEYGIHVDASYPFQVETSYTRLDGMRAMEMIEQMSPRPTAIVTTNPETQIGVMHYCREHHIEIPNDYSLVSYASANDDDLFFIQPTCAVQDHRAIGIRAGELLLERIANPDLPNREVIFPSPVIYGNSVKSLL